MVYRKKPTIVEAVTFEELVSYGRHSGAPIVDGMPWSFSYLGNQITHESNVVYLVSTTYGHTLYMTPGHMLVTNGDNRSWTQDKSDFFTLYEQGPVGPVGIYPANT